MKFCHCITGLFWVLVANVLVSCHSPQHEARLIVRCAAHVALYSGYVQQHYNENEIAMRSQVKMDDLFLLPA